MRMPSPSARRRILIALVAVSLCLTALAWVLAYGDTTLRKTTRLAVERELSALLRGSFEVDRVESLSWGSTRLRGVIVRDEKKRVVLRAEVFEVDFDLLALRKNNIRFTRARLHKAKARLYPGQSLPATLLEALLPKPSGGSSGGTPPSLHFESIRIDDAQIDGDVPGASGIHMTKVAAAARIDVTSEVRIRIFTMRGHSEGPFAVPLELVAGNLTIVDEPFHLDGSFRVERESERVHVRLFYKGEGDALSLKLGLSPLSTDTLRALDVGAPDTLLGDLTGTVNVESAAEHWKFRAALTSAGGPVGVVGTHNPAGQTTVHFTTDGIDLSELFAYTPPIKLGATVDAVAEPDGTVRLHAASPLVDALGIELSQVLAEGTYKDGRLTLAPAGFMYAGGHFDVSGTIDSNSDLALRVRSLIPDVTRDRTLRRQGVQARVSTDLTLTQTAGLLAVEGRAELQHFSYSGVSGDTLSLQGRASGSFEKPDLRVTALGRGVAIGGYPVGEVKIHATGSDGVYRTDLSALDTLGRAATAKVRFEDRESSLRIVANPLTLSVPNREPWRAEADVVIDADGVELRRVLLENGVQHLETQGRFSYSRAYRVDAKLVRFDLGGLRELLAIDLADLDGTVDGTLSLTGVPGQPRIDAHATLDDGVFLGMEGLDASLVMVFVEGRFDAQGEIVLPDQSRLALVMGGTPGRGRSFVDQVASGSYEFGLDFERVPFAVSKPWLAWLGLTPPPGTISAMIRGEGPLNAPVIDVTTRVDDIVLGKWPALDIELSLRHDTHTLTLNKLWAADPLGPLGQASGTLEARLDELFDPVGLRSSLGTRPFTLSASFPQRRLDELPEPMRVAAPVFTSGTIEAHQTDTGPRLALDARAGVPPGTSGVDACGTQRFAEVTIAAEAYGQEVTASAQGTLDGEKLMTALAHADVPVDAWLTGAVQPSLPTTAVKISAQSDALEDIPLLCQVMVGPLKVEISAQDIFAEPPQVSFALSSPALQLLPNATQRQRLGGLKTAQAAGRPFAFDLRGGVERDVVSLIGHLDEGEGATLDLFAAVPRAALAPAMEGRDRPPMEARLRLKNIELARLLVALPITLRAAARVNGETRVSYDLDDDRLGLEGQLSLTEGRLSIPAMGQELSDMHAKLEMSGNRIKITEFGAHDFEGNLRAKGELRFDTLHHALLELYFSLRDFPVRREGAQVSKLSGGLALRADIEVTRTRAELIIGDLRIDLPNDLGQELQDLDAHPSIVVVGEAREKPEGEPYVYEVHVVAKNPPFSVRRTDLSAQVLADLNLRYREPLLTIQGNAELRRGSFELYGKRFDLEESHMAFDGEDQLDPLVSLVATHKIGADEIGVRLEGRLSEPTVTFTHSNPAITDQGEIIAQLLGGRSSDSSTSSTQDATGAAASFLAGATAGLLTEEVRREFGGAIPVLAIESGNQAFRSARIRAGVQLDRLIEKRLGPLRNVVRGAYVEGFVSPGADPDSATQTVAPQSRGGGLLELRFPADFLGSVEYRPIQNWRLDVAWEP